MKEQNSDKSEKTHAILDKESRIEKSKKIINVVSDYKDFKNCKTLDIGTGSGYIPNHLSKYAKEVVSVDIVDERRILTGYKFTKIKNEKLPFHDKSFDAVISNHVIEHVVNQKMHILEMLRVLKDDGVIYLATPNRFWITDPHYRTPFINWMPGTFATIYLRLIRNKKWDIRPISSLYIKKNISGVEAILVVYKILKNPSKYNLNYPKYLRIFIRHMPDRILKFFTYISPTIIYIIKKT